MSSSRQWARAEAAYHRHPDEDADDMDTCQECDEGKVPNPDYDPNEPDPAMMEDQFTDCEECNGTGEVNLSAIARKRYQDDKEDAADRRAEADREENYKRERD